MDGTQRVLGDDMGIRVDHIGIAVNDLDTSSEFWRLIGLEQGDDELNVEQGVNIRFFGSEQGTDATKIELLSPTSTNTPIGRFLETKGPGVQQIAFRVDNLQGLLDKLKSVGVRLINETPTTGAHGSQIAFVHPSSTGGVLVELLQYED
ncbi:MAG: methylmalonyl-CoA epimerase [Marine Group II euryarchaeote MED-G33]|nr:MAG: methylmalonyl-CoA epimerase [Marine Group II euryarchaeote MED-G33]|tara:strand:- start:4675 stop:5121 length:447 start_codon:yes stop_codon:yes gene_type:complete